MWFILIRNCTVAPANRTELVSWSSRTRLREQSSHRSSRLVFLSSLAPKTTAQIAEAKAMILNAMYRIIWGNYWTYLFIYVVVLCRYTYYYS